MRLYYISKDLVLFSRGNFARLLHGSQQNIHLLRESIIAKNRCASYIPQ